MNDILYEVLKSIAILATVLITRYLIPYLKSKTEQSKYAVIESVVKAAVEASEQSIKGDSLGPEKKTQAMHDIYKIVGDKISYEQINDLVESCVFAMNQPKK